MEQNNKYCIDSEKVNLKTVLCLEYTKSLIFLLRWNKTVDMVVGKAYRSLGLVVMDGEESNACDVFPVFLKAPSLVFFFYISMTLVLTLILSSIYLPTTVHFTVK